MTVPRFLDTTYCDANYTRLVGITDVADILAQLTAQLVTNPAAGYKWTEAPAGTFTSPVDAEGRTIVCAFSRISAANLQMILSCGGTTLCTRRIQIDWGGTNVDVYSGKYYVAIDSLRATAEFMIAFLVESTPVPEASNIYPGAGTGYRTNADAVDGNGAYGFLYAINPAGTLAVANRIRCPAYTIAAAAQTGLMAPSGRVLFYDAPIGVATYGWLGRPCQMLVGYQSAQGTMLYTPVDTDGTLGYFRATSWGTGTTGKLWIRIPMPV